MTDLADQNHERSIQARLERLVHSVYRKSINSKRLIHSRRQYSMNFLADVTLLQIKFMPRHILSEVLHEKQWTCILRIGRSYIIANQFHAWKYPF